jgi:hypothetical protein
MTRQPLRLAVLSSTSLPLLGPSLERKTHSPTLITKDTEDKELLIPAEEMSLVPIPIFSTRSKLTLLLRLLTIASTSSATFGLHVPLFVLYFYGIGH